MSQVLEKPILLDETGQSIAGKLDTNADAIVDMLEEIKDAIGTSSEFIPLMIKVTTPPTKTAYIVGETLDLSGMVVNLIASNGTMVDVTSACTCVPASGTVLTDSDTSVAISYLYQKDNLTFTASQPISIRALSSIAVTTPPTITDYSTGDALDLTGIVVTAVYEDGFTRDVTNLCVYNPANGTTLATSDSSVQISYTENGVTKTTSQPISVKELASIAITTPPTKTSYMTGESLDLTGIVVTATYDDSSTLDVTSHCVFSPVNGTTLTRNNTSVTVSYTKGAVTKTASQSITVVSVYGISRSLSTSDSEWNRTDNAVGLTFSASVDSTAGHSDFDDYYPWSDIERVVDGQDTFVKIPKFWFKRWRSSGVEYIQIADGAADGFELHPAFKKETSTAGVYNEYDYILVGAYLCNTSYQSKTNSAPVSNITKSTARTGCQGRGTGYYLWDYATYNAIQMLILVEIADYNSQAKIGKGFFYSVPNTGKCDAIPNLTGVETNTNNIVWRGIEYIWGSSTQHIEGILCSDASNEYKGYWIGNNPNDMSTTDNWTQLGYKQSTMDSKFFEILGCDENNPAYMLPEANSYGSGNGTATTYITDGQKYDSSMLGWREPRVSYGGNVGYASDGIFGLMFIYNSNSMNTKNATDTARLLKLPTT